MKRTICDECGKSINPTHTAHFVHERPIYDFTWYGKKMDFCNSACRDKWVRETLESDR